MKPNLYYGCVLALCEDKCVLKMRFGVHVQLTKIPYQTYVQNLAHADPKNLFSVIVDNQTKFMSTRDEMKSQTASSFQF